MRHPRFLIAPSALAVTLVVALAACTGSVGPNWTYAPPTPAPASQPAASGASGAPSSAAPSGAASQPAASQASGGGGGSTVQISAQGIAFQQQTVTAPANAPFTIQFNNQDSGVPHDIQIKDSSGTEKFKGDVVTGPKQVDYQVPALAAGSYTFVCTIHPNMTGTLTAGG
jgi:plastocyanin